MTDEQNVDPVVRDLTLMLIYLTSWEEPVFPGSPDHVRRCWKGFNFDVLNLLEGGKPISSSHRAKSLYLTEEGEKAARKLLAEYKIGQANK